MSEITNALNALEQAMSMTSEFPVGGKELRRALEGVRRALIETENRLTALERRQATG